jgi:tetratricopeptide (TPR) repeat protein
MAVFAEDRPAVSASIQPTPQQQAAAYLQEQITAISEQLLNDFPNDIYWVKTAVSFHRLCRDYYKATGVLEQACKDFADNFWVHTTAAEVYFNNGEYEKALAHSLNASKISPENSEAQNNIADSLIHLGRYAEAVERLEKTVEATPDSARGHWLLGQGYVQLGHLEKAKACYQKALQLNPRLPDGNYWLAKVCMRLKQPDEAKQYMQAHKAFKAAEEKRRHAWAESRGHHVGKDTSDKEIQAFPEMLNALSVRGYKLYRAQNNVDASKRLLEKTEAVFEKAIAIDPRQPTTLREAAFFYVETSQKLDKAKAYIKEALALKETAKGYYVSGLLYEKKGDTNDALAAFEKAVKLEPTNNTYKVKFNELFQRNL